MLAKKSKALVQDDLLIINLLMLLLDGSLLSVRGELFVNLYTLVLAVLYLPVFPNCLSVT